MLKTSAFQPPWLTSVLTPLTVGVAWIALTNLPAAARPVLVQSQTCSSVIYGSPIPAPVPMNSVTGRPCSFSFDNNPNYRDYNTLRRPIRGTIRNSTLVNPTIIDSTISDSVLVDPVIINTPRSSRRTIQRPGVIYRSPGIQIRIGQ